MSKTLQSPHLRKHPPSGPQQLAAGNHAIGLAFLELEQWSAELWKESSLTRLLLRYHQILRRMLNTHIEISCMSCSTDAHGQRVWRDDSELIAVPWRLRKSDFEFACKAIGSMGTNHSGLVTLEKGDLQSQGAQLFALMMGEPCQHVLVISIPRALVIEEIKWAELSFLSQQLRIAYAWIRRIDRAETLLYRDDLTGLYNGRYLDEAIDREMLRSQRFGQPFSVFFIDLDHLKPINDQHGHLSGSGVLRQFADLLREELREVDSIVRYGGDEFIVLLLGTHARSGQSVAERIRRRTEAHVFVSDQGQPLRLTCSIGLASFPEHAQSKTDLIRLADEAMYQGKHSGKNQVCIATSPPEGERNSL